MATGVHAQGASAVEFASSEACSEAGRSCSPRCAPPGRAPLQGSATAPVPQQRWSGNTPPPKPFLNSCILLQTFALTLESIVAQCLAMLDHKACLLSWCTVVLGLFAECVASSINVNDQPCSTNHGTNRDHDQEYRQHQQLRCGQEQYHFHHWCYYQS